MVARKSEAMTLKNVGVLVGAVLILVGFCLGWFGIRGFGGGVFVNGWQVLDFARSRGAVYVLLYLLPLGALGAALLAFVNRRLAGALATVAGGAFIAWGAFEAVRLLWHTTFLGLWLTLLGAVVLFAAGLATRRRP